MDHFGNTTHYVEVGTPHRELSLVALSTVTVARPVPDLTALDGWTVGAAAAALAARRDRVEILTYRLPSPLVTATPEVTAYAGRFLGPDRPLGQALGALLHGVHADFAYRGGVTSVSTTLGELLERRAGVCQDFAHLAVGCLRAVGLPARYVSGYLETEPPTGLPRLQGADASHAWLQVLTPSPDPASPDPEAPDPASPDPEAPDPEAPLVWWDLDPTNDQQADSRYVVAAWGRDYADVTPVKGVIFTEGAGSALEVGVNVVRLDPHLPAAHPTIPGV